MQRTHFGQHDQDCFGCRIQTIQVSPAATPSRRNPSAAPRQPDPAWERGIPKDERGLPFLKSDGSPMGSKEYSEKRSSIDALRRKLKNSTQPVTPTPTGS